MQFLNAAHALAIDWSDQVVVGSHGGQAARIPGGFTVDRPGIFIAEYLIGEPLREASVPKSHRISTPRSPGRKLRIQGWRRPANWR